jgi:hypothetical protein
VSTVKFPGKINMRLSPQGQHHLHLLHRALAAVVEVFVEADELDLVPADADSKPEAAARQLVERGRLLCDQDSLPLCQNQHANRKADPLRAA